MVIHGVVSSKAVQRDGNGRIYTKVDLLVTESWKGKINGQHFVLVHAGGVLGEESSVSLGQPEYAVGEEVVAFAVLNHRGEGVTIGLSQGKFQVKQGWVTQETKVHDPIPGVSRAQEDGKGSLSLLELKQRVQKGQP